MDMKKRRDMQLAYISDEAVMEEQRIGRKILQKLNFADRSDFDGIAEIVKELLGKSEGAWINPPFYCDYGSHIEVGKEATFFALAETTINGIRRTGIELGNRVVVYGAGIVGQLAARFLLAGGCTEIFVVNRSEARLKHLPDQRAIIPICSTKEDPISIIKEYTYGDMADIVIETTGNADAIPEEFLALHQQGKLCMLSSPKKKTLIDFHDCCNAVSVNIIGAHTSSQAPVKTYDNPWTCERNSETFFKLIYNKQVDMSEMITHRVSYKEAPQMYQMLLKDRTQAMGVVLDWR